MRFWELGKGADTRVGACVNCTSCVEFKPRGLTRSDWAAYLGLYPHEFDQMLRDDAARENGDDE